jgi:hypothetical protein
MQLARTAFLGFSLMTTACASSPTVARPKEPLRGGVLEFRFDSYDGSTVKGRVLFGATIDTLVIDAHQSGWGDVDFKNLHACGKTEPLEYIPFCSIVSPDQPDEIITLRPGAWYGGTMTFPLFSRKWGVIGPDCFEGDLVGWAKDGRIIAKLPIRVERTDIRAAPKDEGIKSP